MYQTHQNLVTVNMIPQRASFKISERVATSDLDKEAFLYKTIKSICDLEFSMH